MKVLYRADGGHPIGTGHLFRATRIIRALSEHGPVEVHLVTAEDPVVSKIVDHPNILVYPLPARTDMGAVKPRFEAHTVLDILASSSFDLVAIDMLDTAAEDVRAVAAAGVPIVSFDDRGEGRRLTSTLINVLVEEPDPASLPPSVNLIEGGDYVVLDPLFAVEHNRGFSRDIGHLRNVFVAMGGADALGLTIKVARALKQVVEIERVEIVCGPAFPHRGELEDLLRDAPWRSELLASLPSLIPCYRRCDLAIVAGGLTMYEVCCTGTPSLAVCQPIDHQWELSDRLTAAGAMATVGWGADATDEQIAQAVEGLSGDPTRRERMSVCGPQIVDGRGAARVAEALLETARRL